MRIAFPLISIAVGQMEYVKEGQQLIVKLIVGKTLSKWQQISGF